MSCNEWNQYSLEEVIEKFIDYRGRTPKKVEKGIPLITAKVVKSGRIEETSEFIKYEDYDKWMTRGIPLRGDVVMTTEAPLGEVAQIETDEKIALAQRIITLRGKKDILDNTFLRYSLQSPIMQWRINSRASGTTVIGIKSSELKKVSIDLPPLGVQKDIAQILLSLDKKIELNNEMNKTLEDMAQALFKRWFIDFEFPNEDGKPYKSSGGEMVESELGMIPKGWRIDNLKDISIVTMGVSPSSNSYNENKVGLPLLNGAADFEGKLIKPSKYTSEPKKVCKCGDMIFGVRATIGNTVFADKEYALGRGVASVSPTSDISREFIYFSLNSSMNKLISSASGSVFLNLKKADITDLKLCYSQVALNKFNEITKKLINKIIENDIESEILKQQRDSLLPKLMSGEIRVDNMKANL